MQITIDLSESELEQVRQLAEQRGMTLSQLARILLLKEMRAAERAQPPLENRRLKPKSGALNLCLSR
ncbi:MAG: hypothetical protein N2554_05025 [Fimbriimonadales bacterium]|nr:hypothetical protein [Fimbriimonadales bacterium]